MTERQTRGGKAKAAAADRYELEYILDGRGRADGLLDRGNRSGRSTMTLRLVQARYNQVSFPFPPPFLPRPTATALLCSHFPISEQRPPPRQLFPSIERDNLWLRSFRSTPRPRSDDDQATFCPSCGAKVGKLRGNAYFLRSLPNSCFFVFFKTSLTSQL